MTEEFYDSMKAWLAAHPSIKELAEKFPSNSIFLIYGVKHYLIGYSEPDLLILTVTDPIVDYEKAMKNQIEVSAKHFELAGKIDGPG